LVDTNSSLSLSLSPFVLFGHVDTLSNAIGFSYRRLHDDYDDNNDDDVEAMMNNAEEMGVEIMRMLWMLQMYP